MRRASAPNETDRARFGFQTKRSSQSASVPQGRPKPLGQAKSLHNLHHVNEEDAAAQGALSAREDGREARELTREARRVAALSSMAAATEEASSSDPVSLVPLLATALGDPDAVLPLLRTKPVASKYDFKGRITSLEGQNRSLRSTLSEMRDGHHMLAEALSRIQQDINWRLRAVEGEAAGARQQLSERCKMTEMLQAAVRTVWREEVASQDTKVSPRQANRAVDGEALAELQEKLVALRQCCAAEAARATLAESIAQQREAELEAARAELDAARSSNNQRVRDADEKAARATELVKEAGQLLTREAQESARHHQEVMATTTEREKVLLLHLARAEARVAALEGKLSEAASPSESHLPSGGHGGA